MKPAVDIIEIKEPSVYISEKKKNIPSQSMMIGVSFFI